MRAKKAVVFFTLLFAISVTIPFNRANSANITIDTDNEYTLSVDASIDNVSEYVYAKFTKSKSDVEYYYLLIEEDESGAFEKAFKKTGMSDEYYSVSGFNITLFYEDPEGEKDDKEKKDAINILIPIPDDSQEHADHPEDYAFYQLSGGNLKALDSLRTVTADDVHYIQFDLTTYGTYGFVYRNSDYYDKLEEEEEEENEDSEDEGGDDDWDEEENNEDGNGDDSNENTELVPTGDEKFHYTTDEEDEAGIEYSDEDFDLEDDSEYEYYFEYGVDGDDVLYYYGDDEEEDDDAPYYYEDQERYPREDEDEYEEGGNESGNEEEIGYRNPDELPIIPESGGPHSDSNLGYYSYVGEGTKDYTSSDIEASKREESHNGTASDSDSDSESKSKKKQSEDSKSKDTKSTDDKSADAKSEDSKSEDAKSKDSKSKETKTQDSKSEDTKNTENKKNSGGSSKTAAAETKQENITRASTKGNVIPKTGDDFPYFPLVGLSSISSIGLAICITKLFKRH